MSNERREAANDSVEVYPPLWWTPAMQAAAAVYGRTLYRSDGYGYRVKEIIDAYESVLSEQPQGDEREAMERVIEGNVDAAAIRFGWEAARDFFDALAAPSNPGEPTEAEVEKLARHIYEHPEHSQGPYRMGVLNEAERKITYTPWDEIPDHAAWCEKAREALTAARQAQGDTDG